MIIDNFKDIMINNSINVGYDFPEAFLTNYSLYFTKKIYS